MSGTFHGKAVDNKLAQLSQLRKMVNSKLLSLSIDTLTKLQNQQKFLKYLKKQNKEQRLGDEEINSLCSGFFQDIDEFLRCCYYQYRLQKTDFQALFIKIKQGQQNNKKSKVNLEQMITFHKAKQPQILLNIKDNLLFQIRNQIQGFNLQTLLNKTNQILVNLDYFRDATTQKSNWVRQLTSEICRNYHIMPFHNFTHGFGVFLSFYCLMLNEEIKALTNDFQIVFWLIACLCHDVQHCNLFFIIEGLNTLFQVKVNSNMSVQFAKFSVMQKMHLSKTLQILTKKQKTNKLYQSLSEEQKTKARKIISRAILATDMVNIHINQSKHYQYYSKISQSQLNKDKNQDKQTILQILVHACDIENPTLQFQSYMYWAHLVCLQFHDQTIKEKQWNVQVTEFLKFDTLTYFYKNQHNFAGNNGYILGSIVLPLWQQIQTMFSSLKPKEYVNKIKKNISILNQTLRRNTQHTLIHKQFQQYLNNKLQN